MGLFSTEKSDKAKFKKIKEDGCVVTLTIEVPNALVQEETQNRLVRIQQRAKIPGFRPGKAPLEMVKKSFEGHAREEMVDSLARKYVPEALKELNLRPVAVPALEDVQLEESKPLKLQVRVEVPPTVAPKDYTKIPVKRKPAKADDKALDKRIEELREANARLEKASVEKVAKDSYVVMDYEGFQDGKPMANAKGAGELVDMSSDQTVEGLQPALLGMKLDEQKDVAVKINGKDVTLKVVVKEIKTKVLPAVDAEFAKDLGFDSVDALKTKLREVMDEETKAQSDRDVTQQIEQALLKANKISVPPSLIEQQLEHLADRVRRQLVGPKGELPEDQEKDLREKLRQRAEDEVRLGFLLPAIAEKEKLEAGEADLKAELDKNLASVEEESKKDEIRKLFEERKEQIASMIRDRKTVDFLRTSAKITDEK